MFTNAEVGVQYTDSISVDNVGTGELQVYAPALSGASDFQLDAPAFPVTIPPGGSRTIWIDYLPQDLYDDFAQITITSDDDDEPTIVVEVVGEPGNEPDIDVDPTAIAFGNVLVGNSSSLPAIIENVGVAVLTLGTLSINGTSEYTLTLDPSGDAIPAGATVGVEVTYTPVDSGIDIAYLEIPSDDPDEPVFTVNLSGADHAVGDIEVDTTSLNFVCVDYGAVGTEFIEVTNLGTTTLDVSAIHLIGSAEFSYSSTNLPGPIGPGYTRYIEVNYVPTNPTPDYATLTIVSDDPDEPTVDISIYGEPCQFS